MIAQGDTAPDFTLPDHDGRPVRLADLRGRSVVLYFYPKDDTPGCTKQACALRERSHAFAERGAVVLGVSPDSPASHRKFRSKYDLDFTLLADEDHQVAEAYGVWAEKQMFGRRYWGNQRATFVIDETGRVAHVLPKVDPAAHADQVLDLL